jgi:transcriptional regulator with XRE-family HTH domain
MGKEVRGLLEDPPLSEGGPSVGASGDPSGDPIRDPIGRYLAGQRRLRGISLAELAERTKIPLRSLERLESGAFDAAPDGFARGFVRTVADALGLDVDDAVMRLLQEPPDDEVERAASRATLQRRAGVLVFAAVGGLVLAGVWALGSALFSWVTEDEREVVLEYRRDAVRDLVDAPPLGRLDSGRSDVSGVGGGEESPRPPPLDSAGGVRPD